MEYLGHVILAEGVATDSAKTEEISKWPAPQTVKEVRSFLGLTGYYRRFLKSYGVIARPLTDLLKREGFDWGSKEHKSFDTQTKDDHCSGSCFANFQEQFIVESNASGYGFGAVFMQSVTDSILR